MKAQLNYRDGRGRVKHAPIEIPDDASLLAGEVSITQDRSLVLVRFRSPWKGEYVEYSYRNVNDLEIGDRALIDITHNLVVGKVVAFGDDGRQRTAHKPAFRLYQPTTIEEWA